MDGYIILITSISMWQVVPDEKNASLVYDDSDSRVKRYLKKDRCLIRTSVVGRCRLPFYLLTFPVIVIKLYPTIIINQGKKLLVGKRYTLQKFGMYGEINCLEKRFKISHILHIRKPKVSFFIFHFVILYFFPNESPGLCRHKM